MRSPLMRRGYDMKRPAWLVRPAYFKLPSLGWAWLILAASIAAGASWQTRYSPIHVQTDDSYAITYVWDRWRHRGCDYITGPAGEGFLSCYEADV
jgi:hypothetical protein